MSTGWLASLAKTHLHRSIFFYTSIMYLLSLRYSPNEYRYVGYIPTEEHAPPPTIKLKTWLAQDYILSVPDFPQLLMYHLKKKKNQHFLEHNLVPEVIANSSKWTEIFLPNFVFLRELWFPRKHFYEQAL